NLLGRQGLIAAEVQGVLVSSVRADAREEHPHRGTAAGRRAGLVLPGADLRAGGRSLALGHVDAAVVGRRADAQLACTRDVVLEVVARAGVGAAATVVARDVGVDAAPTLIFR